MAQFAKDAEYGIGKCSSGESGVGYEHGAHEKNLDRSPSWHVRLQEVARRFGVEQRGIERVPDNERTDVGMSKIGTLWFSTNMSVASFAIGALAVPVFGLGFVDSALSILLVNILGILPVCYFSTFGPKFGLRQIVFSRFWFGYHGVKLVALFNIFACIGWSSVNIIVGAQLLHAVNDDIPGWVGILVIGFSTLFICLFGYKTVHVYERWSWIPSLIVFLIVLGEFAYSGQFRSALPIEKGPTEAGAVLSFAASIYGFATSWASFAADYTVYQPVHRSSVSVFFWTFGGLFIPLVFTELLGAAVMTASLADSDYLDAYEGSGIGGVLATVLVPSLGHFGRFCLVVLALSIIANNCPNTYSVSLSLQVLSRETQRVPRSTWTLLGTCAYVAISVPGYDHFVAWLENFMLVIGYWLAIYEGIALSEHFFFRHGFAGYKAEEHADPHALPPGIAAMLAFCAGIAGAVMGMAQEWWKGSIGRLCGARLGGDVGFELAFFFSATVYVALRTVEKSYFGR